MLMWHNLNMQEGLKKLQSLFSKKEVIGALSGEYMLFKCTTCGEEVDLDYKGGDPAMPHFTYKCSCGNKGRFKLSAPKVHNLPLRLPKK